MAKTVNGVPFRQWLVPSSKYSIKAPYSMVPKKITLHNTDNEMPAHNEISYMRNNNNQTSYHVAIDEKEAVQGLKYNRNGWHSGDGGNGYGNRNKVGIEICRNYDRTRKTTKLNEPLQSMYTQAEQNTIKFTAQLCIDLGIVANNANIKTHNDWSGKWCPSKILNEGRLQLVKNAIIAEYNRLVGDGKDQTSKPVTVTGKVDQGLSFKQVVDKAIAGGYGNMPARRENINNRTNYTYDAVQAEINSRLSGNKATVTPKKSIDQLAQEVIDGRHGSGDARKKSLGNQYDAVQKRVNEMLAPAPKPKPAAKTIDQLAQEVIDGKHGSGDARRKSLGSQYSAVQARVNQKLGAVSTPAPKPAPKPATKTTTQLAQEVIDGKHGSGDARKRSLGSRYNAVQAEVNRLLGAKKAPTPARKSTKQLADDVEKGLHGTGDARKRSLGSRYNEVQAEINRRYR